MTDMQAAKTISITLPPDMLLKAQAIAETEHRTVSELFQEVLCRYMACATEWDALLRRTRAIGESLGVESESDVERMSDEFRQEKHRAVAS